MRATKLEFRLRMPIHAAIILLGFWAPWIEAWHIGNRHTLLETLSLELSRLGLLRFSVATTVVLLAASLIAAIAVILRVWGTAFLGPATVQHTQMQAAALMVDGPYRYVRNPLYLGLGCMVAALAFLMPPTGSLVTLMLFLVFDLRLILGEEAFLAAQLGEPYRDYLRAVPRLVPRLRTSLPRAGVQPQWFRAVLAEIMPIGVFVALAFFSWSYDHLLMDRVILISVGASLIVRALLPKAHLDAKPAE